MSEMSAAVVLRLRDELTKPAHQAANSVKSLVKDLEKLKSLSGKSFGGANKQIAALTRDIKKATEATKGLRTSMARPPTEGYQFAARSISRVTSEAEKASRAVRGLNRSLQGGGSVRGGGGASRGGGHGGSRGGAHGVFGAGGHFGRHIARHALGTAAGLGLYAVGSEIAEGIAESIKAGMEQSFEKAHTKTMLQMQGESVGDINNAIAQANKMARSLPSFTSAQHLEAIAELRPALLGGLKEATDLAPMFQKSVAILEAVKQGAGATALKGVNTHGEALDLVRALEIKGETSHKGWTEDQNNKNMDHYVNSITKAIVGMNGQIKAADFHSAFKFSRGDASNWTEEFSTEILPTIMNELKKSSKTDASQTGNALKSMSRAVVDNVMTPQAMNNWDALGMYGPGVLKAGKGGKKTVVPDGHMLGYNVFQSNPYQFVQDYLLPHMKEHGVDIGNRKEVVAQLGGLFGNRTANAIAAILATQQAQIKKDQDNIRKATGTSGYAFLMNNDPTTREQILAAAKRELGGAVGDLALPGKMRAMAGIIDWSHRTAGAIQNSAYGKSVGGYYESAIAGMFGQRLGRKGLNGRNGEYFAAGRSLGGGFSHLLSSFGKLGQTLEQMGALSGAIRGAGTALNGFASIVDAARTALSAFSHVPESVQHLTAEITALTAGFVGFKGAKFFAGGFGLSAAAAELTSAAAALKGAAVAGSGVDLGKGKGSIGSKLNGAGKVGLVTGLLAALDLPQDGIKQNGGHYYVDRSKQDGFNYWVADEGAKIKSWLGGIFGGGAPSSRGSPFGALGHIGGVGGGDMIATGPVTKEMSSLMASLAGIAAKGVNVPVTVDTGPAEAKINALINKANSIGSGGGTGKDGRFSKSLSDTGQ